MIRARRQVPFAALLQNALPRFSGVKQMQLSPLSAIALVFLSAIFSGTAIFALYAIVGPLNPDSGAGAPDWTPPALTVVELSAPKLASADVESLSRPIFSKNRKPLRKTDSASAWAATPSNAPTDLIVTAIVRHKKAAQAFLFSAGSPQGAWRKVGDAVDAWTVASITSAEVILQSGAQSAKVKLYKPPLAPHETQH